MDAKQRAISPKVMKPLQELLQTISDKFPGTLQDFIQIPFKKFSG